MDTKIRKEFYLLVYFVIFGGGGRYFNVDACLLCVYGSKGDILLWLSPWKKIIEGAPNGCVPISIWEDMRRNLRRFFELSPSEDFEEGMFSKKDEYYLVGKPYFCSSRGGANGALCSVLTRKS